MRHQAQKTYPIRSKSKSTNPLFSRCGILSPAIGTDRFDLLSVLVAVLGRHEVPVGQPVASFSSRDSQRRNPRTYDVPCCSCLPLFSLTLCICLLFAVPLPLSTCMHTMIWGWFVDLIEGSISQEANLVLRSLHQNLVRGRSKSAPHEPDSCASCYPPKPMVDERA